MNLKFLMDLFLKTLSILVRSVRCSITGNIIHGNMELCWVEMN